MSLVDLKVSNEVCLYNLNKLSVFFFHLNTYIYNYRTKLQSTRRISLKMCEYSLKFYTPVLVKSTRKYLKSTLYASYIAMSKIVQFRSEEYKR